MNMKEGRLRRLDRLPESLLDELFVVEALAVPHVDDQMLTGIGQALAGNKMVFWLFEGLGALRSRFMGDAQLDDFARGCPDGGGARLRLAACHNYCRGDLLGPHKALAHFTWTPS